MVKIILMMWINVVAQKHNLRIVLLVYNRCERLVSNLDETFENSMQFHRFLKICEPQSGAKNNIKQNVEPWFAQPDNPIQSSIHAYSRYFSYS
jgi:hypothetical protein